MAFLAVKGSSSQRLHIYTVGDWSELSGVPTLPGSLLSVAFSPDGTRMACGHQSSPYLSIFDVADWLSVTGPSQPGYNVNSVVYNSDGSLMALAINSGTATERIRVYDTSDWSAVLDTLSIGSNPDVVAFDRSDALLAIAYGASPMLVVLDTSDWSTVSGTPTFSSAVNTIAFSPTDDYLAVGGNVSSYLRVYDTTDWSEVSGLPTFSNTVYAVAFSPDGAYLAVGHYGSPYLTVLDTSDWSEVTVTATLPYAPASMAFSSDGNYLAIGHNYSSTRDELSIIDTSDWSLVSDTPDPDTSVSALGFSIAAEDSNIFSTIESMTEVGIGYHPDIFAGLAVSHAGDLASQGVMEATQLSLFKKMNGKYYPWGNLDPVSDYHDVISFSPGGGLLLVGGDAPPYTGVAERTDNQYKEIDDYFWGSLLTGGRTLSLSWSDDDRYQVGHFYNTTASVPMVMYWDPAAESYARSSSPGMESLRYYRRAEISPDGEYVILTASYSALYDQSPFIWAYRNDRNEPDLTFTALTINLGAVSFSPGYGLQIAWSTDSAYFVVKQYVFKWNSTNEEFEIVATLSAGGSDIFKAAWSPDSVYLAAIAGNSVYIHKRTGDAFTLVDTITLSYVTAVCWSKDGSALFVGSNPSSGTALHMYNRVGDVFTLDTTSDFSSIEGAVVSISAAPEPLNESVGALVVTEALLSDGQGVGLMEIGGFFETHDLFFGTYFKPEVTAGFFVETDELFGDAPVDIERGASVPFYRCILTGVADGVDDVLLPMTSFQSRQRDGEPTWLEVVVPDVTKHSALVAARANGELIVEKGLRYADGMTYCRIIARGTLEAPASDRGPSNSSIRLSGTKITSNVHPKTVALAGVSSESVQKNGKRRVRCAVDFYARAGDTVTWGNNESMVAGLVTVMVNGANDVMFIAEA